MSIDALLTPYKGLAPFLSRPLIDVYTSFGGLTATESTWGTPAQPEDGDTPFVQGWNEGFTRGASEASILANKTAAKNYKHGINKGYIEAFEYMIGGPKVALVDTTGDVIKWHTGETITDIIGTNEKPTLLRRTNPKYVAFDPENKWHVDTANLSRTGTLAQDPKKSQTKFVYGEYDGLLYLDMDIVRTKAQGNTMTGQVVTELSKPTTTYVKDRTPLLMGEKEGIVRAAGEDRLVTSYLQSEAAGVKKIIGKLAQANIGQTAFTPTSDYIKKLSETSLLEYKKLK